MTFPALLLWLNLLLIGVEAATIAYLPGSFFPRRRGMLFFALSLCFLAGLLSLNAFLLENYALFRILCTIMLGAIWIWLNFKGKIINILFVAAFSTSYQAIIDVAFLSIFMRLFPRSDSLLDDPRVYYFLCYTAKLLELLGVVLICTVSKQRSNPARSSFTSWLRLLFFPTATLSIALFLTRIILKTPEVSGELLGCSIILLIVDLMSIMLTSYLEKQQAAVLENTVLHQNLKLESEHIRSIQEAYARQRKQTHDFNNQLSVLRGMAERNAPEKEFADYLGKILTLEFPSVTYLNTHRLVVDVILSQKAASAANNNIAFDMQLDDLADYPMSDDAIVIILTNLIDNAMEACKKIEDPAKRLIKLKMQQRSTVAILYIENTTAEPVQIRDNRIATTKPDAFAHGYGLKNVISSLEGGGWMYAMRYAADRSVFCFSARIPKEHEKNRE